LAPNSARCALKILFFKTTNLRLQITVFFINELHPNKDKLFL
jgi:hypothetical protein